MDSKTLQINRSVRRIFVRHWIDLGRLSIRTTDGKVLLRGRVDRITGVNEPLTGAIMGSMMADIRRIRDVIRVTANFDNWINDGGLWRSAESKQASLGVLDATSAASGMTLNIGRETGPRNAGGDTHSASPPA